MNGPEGRRRLPRLLRELAGLHGIQSSYTAADGRRRFAPSSSLLAVLAALGSPVERMRDVPDAIRTRRLESARRVLEPVTVAWDGRIGRPGLSLRLPSDAAGDPVRILLAKEGEPERELTGEWSGGADLWATGRTEEVEGALFVQTAIRGLPALPDGYHRLRVIAGQREASSLVISAPRRRDGRRPRSWGVFMPLYALRSSRSWPIGDLGDLQSLLEWVRGLGGDLVATLPMLATFLGDEVFEPSPYSPASRLFWNELFLDLERVPEAETSGEAGRLMRSAGFRRELRALRRDALVDYRRTMAAKRRVLKAMCGQLFSNPGPRWTELRRWIRDHPTAADYAAFRAMTERRTGSWRTWPQRERDGHLRHEGGNRNAYRYHLYVQWLMAGQMEQASRTAADLGSGLYFDVPLGVHPDGYDVWRNREMFVLGASAGAPPDPFFTEGQDWGFPPLHPERIREQGYGYHIACLRHLLRHAGVLRIDHVMGLHRLFFVPHGLEAGRGVYVRYRPEELYAILSLEARRGGAVLVGEDLGTVPAEVRRGMARHHVYRSFVAEYECRSDPKLPIPRPPVESLATVGTHDMPPFAAYWRGLEVTVRMERGWMTPEEGRREMEERRRVRRAVARFLSDKGWLPARISGQGDPAGPKAVSAVLRALLAYLAASRARIVVVNLEDLWGETAPHNVPGTTTEYPNWRRKARFGLEEFTAMPEVRLPLQQVGRLRDRPDGSQRGSTRPG